MFWLAELSESEHATQNGVWMDRYGFLKKNVGKPRFAFEFGIRYAILSARCMDLVERESCCRDLPFISRSCFFFTLTLTAFFVSSLLWFSSHFHSVFNLSI